MEARRLSSDTEIPAVGATVGDFWAWAFSDVLNNTERGVLAEFLVGSALGVVDGVRVEWNPFDLLYEDAKIEIKSAAYVQRWFQKKHSVVEWKGIGEQKAWNAATGTYSEEKKRWAADLLTNPAKHGCRHDERKSATPAGIPPRGPGRLLAPQMAVVPTAGNAVAIEPGLAPRLVVRE